MAATAAAHPPQPEPPGPADLPLPRAEAVGDRLVLRHVIYGAIEGFRPLALDLHLPRRAADAPLPPVLVYVHGGAFRIGHRAALPPTLEAIDPFRLLPAEGIAVASVDYRLSGEAPYPACVDDVVTAIAWLRRRGDEVGIDGGRVATWGESAGGYLAVKSGLDRRVDPPVSAIVDWYAPVDFLLMADQGSPRTADVDSPESQLMGAPIRSIPEATTAASLITDVRPDAPPLLVMHGSADHMIPVRQAEALAAAYRAAGAAHRVWIIDGADHTFPGVDPDSLADAVVGFLRDHLLGG